MNPWTGTKLPENTVNTPIAPAATQNAANKPANTNTAPAETPTVSAPQAPSPKVQEALDALNEIKADGGTVAAPKGGLKPSEEVNIIVEYKGDILKIRVETHPLSPNLGGDYVTPIRHLNVDLTPTPTIPLPNNGHIILPPLK